MKTKSKLTFLIALVLSVPAFASAATTPMWYTATTTYPQLIEYGTTTSYVDGTNMILQSFAFATSSKAYLHFFSGTNSPVTSLEGTIMPGMPGSIFTACTTGAISLSPGGRYSGFPTGIRFSVLDGPAATNCYLRYSDYWFVTANDRNPGVFYILDAVHIHNSGDQNNAVWTIMNPVPSLSLSDATETENDGLVDAKGVADKTVFTFTVTATGEPDSVELVTTDILGTSVERTALTKTGDAWSVSKTFPRGTRHWYLEAKKGTQTADTATQTITTGYSNVAFLPGIEGSRMYEPLLCDGGVVCETKLWEPRMTCCRFVSD